MGLSVCFAMLVLTDFGEGCLVLAQAAARAVAATAEPSRCAAQPEDVHDDTLLLELMQP